MADQAQSWKPCPPGELTAMVDRAKVARRKSHSSSLTIAGVLVLSACLSLAYLQWVEPAGAQAPLTCAEVHPLLVSYHQQTLPPELRELVEAHLAECAECRNFLEQVQAGEIPPACCSGADGPPCAAP